MAYASLPSPLTSLTIDAPFLGAQQHAGGELALVLIFNCLLPGDALIVGQANVDDTFAETVILASQPPRNFPWKQSRDGSLRQP